MNAVFMLYLFYFQFLCCLCSCLTVHNSVTYDIFSLKIFGAETETEFELVVSFFIDIIVVLFSCITLKNVCLQFFDEIKIEDPRVAELCAKTTEPSPYAILLTCLQR